MFRVALLYPLFAVFILFSLSATGTCDSPFVTGDDANAILQAAFAQAGVDLSPSSGEDEQSSSSSSTAEQSYSSRPTLSERLRSTLRFVRRPSLLLRRHRLFSPSQLLIPIIASPTAPPPSLMQLNQMMKPMMRQPVYPQQSQQIQPMRLTDRKSSNTIESIRQTPRSPIPLTRVPIKDHSKMKAPTKSSKIISSTASKSKSHETWIPTNHLSVGAATVNGFKPIINGYSTYTMSSSGSDSLNSSSSSISPSLLEAKEWKQIVTPVSKADASKSSDKVASSSNSKVSIASPSASSLFRKESQLIDVNEVADRSVAESSLNELTKLTALPLSTGDILAEMSKVMSSAASVSNVKRKSECTHKNLGWCEYSPDSYPEAFVTAVVKECRDTIDRMYVEVPQNLASFDDFVPFSPAPSNQGSASRVNASSAGIVAPSANSTSSARGGQSSSWSWADYKQSLTLCDSSRKYIRPSVAQDITGRWFVIVQSNLYHQSIPVELCTSPGSVCNGLGECGINARCVQRNSQHLLISIDLDKEHDCPSMRLYRFPSGCVCDHASYY